MAHESLPPATFVFRGQAVDVIRLQKSWLLTVGTNTVEGRSLDDALTALFGMSPEVLRLEIEILDWARAAAKQRGAA